MKYLTLILLIIFSVLVYKNKDYLAQYTEGGLATVLSSVGDNYVEPKIDLQRIKASIDKATSTPMRSQNESKSFSQPKSYSFFPVVWNFYLNNKFWYNTKHSFQAYSPQTFYFSDESWEYWQENGFYLGTKINKDSFLNKTKFMYNININGPTELNTYFQYCAKPFPEHVYFKDINALERKLVQFSNNKGDKNLKIGAKGEVGAFAVVYDNGGVCAKFVGDNGKAGFFLNFDELKTFYDNYSDKKIKEYSFYHTHDKTSDTEGLLGKVYDKKGREIGSIGTIPSPADLDTIYNMNKYFNWSINVRTKIISSAGNGVEFKMSKQSQIVKDGGITDFLKSMIGESMNSARSESMNKGQRKKPIAQDIRYMIKYAAELYKDYLGVEVTYYNIK